MVGTVPSDSAARKHPLVAADDPFGPRVEAYRKLRTNLQFIDVDVPHKALLFTSALPDEGKSSTVCNLAITLAQFGKRVIVVEADLRARGLPASRAPQQRRPHRRPGRPGDRLRGHPDGARACPMSWPAD